MPITAPPTALPDSSPTDSLSPDGHIRAVVDDEFGGVLLIVDYTLSDVTLPQPLASPFACTLYRSTPDGTTDRVRGGDPYLNYGKAGSLYDQEAPLNTLMTYWVVPEMADGTDGPPCAGVQVQTSNPYPGMWLVTPNNPDSAINAMASDGRKGTLTGRNNMEDILGAQNPAFMLQTRGGVTTSMQFYTDGEAQYLAMKELVKDNIIFRKSTSWERPDGWFIVGDVSYEPGSDIFSGWYLWTMALVQTDRPDTAGQFVTIPGHTLADRKAEYPTFNDVIQRQFGGNLLLEEDSEFDSVVNWGNGSNTTVAQDLATPPRKGTGSMKLTATASGAVAASAPYNVQVTPGEEYEFTTWAYNAAGGRPVHFEVDWKDSANTYLGFAASTPLPLSATQWTYTTWKVIVPPGVTNATLILLGQATTAGDTFNFDVVSFGMLP